MGRIVSAGFQSQSGADTAARALLEAGFPRGKIAVFYLTPPRDDGSVNPIDPANASPGAEAASVTGPSGAGIGAAIGTVIGAASAPLLGPLGIAGGAGIGAYVGSLYGALGGMKDDPKEGLEEDGMHKVSGPSDPADADAARIHEGMRVAVQVDGDDSDRRARRALQSSEALDVAVGEGQIADSMIVDERPGT